jgi:hypothetical protein
MGDIFDFGGFGIERARTEARVGEAAPVLFTGAFDQPVVRKVVVSDNSPFIERVNTDVLAGKLKRPTKNVVVTQDPAPGEQVPLGTPITLTLTIKDIIPLDSLGVVGALATKFADAGQLGGAIDTSENASALKGVLAKKQKFEELSDADRGVAEGFLGQIEGLSENDRSKAFDDIGFVFNL